MEDNKEKDFQPASFNCDTGILGKLHLTYWKHWFFNVEIFTYFYNLEKSKK